MLFQKEKAKMYVCIGEAAEEVESAHKIWYGFAMKRWNGTNKIKYKNKESSIQIQGFRSKVASWLTFFFSA